MLERSPTLSKMEIDMAPASNRGSSPHDVNFAETKTRAGTLLEQGAAVEHLLTQARQATSGRPRSNANDLGDAPGDRPLAKTMRFVGLLLTSLLVGTMFGVWLGFDPAALSAAAYVEMQQNAIRALNTTLPALGLVCIVLTVTLAALSRHDRRACALLIAAAMCLIAAGLITRFANQPINAVVMTWTAQAPAVNWTELRDAWWRWHTLRTVAGVGALALALLAALGRRNG
jgi:uncharacterized membrane protein